MNIKWFAPSLLALCVASTGAIKAKAYEAQPLPSAASYQDRDQDRWEQPPDAYQDAQRRGFHEGIEAARHDFADHRRADADDHEVYKHPPVEACSRAVSEGFRERIPSARTTEHDQGMPQL